jgi:hypothetical protein
MKKIQKLCLVLLFTISVTHSLSAQSDPQLDRPIQQCIINNPDNAELLKKEFSMGHWIGKLIENCQKLQNSSGKGGGPHVVALLKMEKELDEMITLAEGCEALGKGKEIMLEMKTIFKEKEKVESFKRGNSNTNNDNLFEEDDEIITMSLTRNGAGKIKNLAEKLKKTLRK